MPQPSEKDPMLRAVLTAVAQLEEDRAALLRLAQRVAETDVMADNIRGDGRLLAIIADARALTKGPRT